MSVSITLNFPDAAAAADALARLAGVIAPEDRPDAGASIVPQANPSPAEVFGAVPPLLPAAAPALALPATAAPTAPVLPDAATPPTAVTAPTAAPSADVDSTGLPWDARIHSDRNGTTGGLNKDGTWRAKKNVDKAVAATVEAQLRAQAGGASPAAAAPAQLALPALPAINPSPPVLAMPPALAPAQTPPAAAPQAEGYAQLFARISPNFVTDAAGSMAKLTRVLARHGMKSPAEAATRPDVVAEIAAEFPA